MFAFNSLNDEQIAAVQNRGLLNDGRYVFIVKDVKQSISKSSNQMLEVKIGVVGGDGERVLTDYLVATESMIFKLKHFCESIGFENEYKDGKFNPQNCVGKKGYVIVGVQKGNALPDGSGFYRDKNVVKDYCKPESHSSKNAHDGLNDDINF